VGEKGRLETEERTRGAFERERKETEERRKGEGVTWRVGEEVIERPE
jgi:hypothetical protein